MERRDAIKLMGLMAATSSFSFACTDQQVEEARQGIADSIASGTTKPGTDYERQFFTEHEYDTVTVLADMIIPADERSGSASDAGVPVFIDFIMTDDLLPDRDQQQTAMRGGLAWLDHQCLERFGGKLFVECSRAQRKQLLDLIAYPKEAPPELEPGVQFFSSFRDLTASGFFSSKMGVEDLQYQGNKTLAEWPGCPKDVLRHIGLST